MKSKRSSMKEAHQNFVPQWEKWGPYLAERAWGTVREDYSANGDPWNYFPHDLAHKKSYRWGEDGIAGISDRYQVLCFSPAFWNEKDQILKERLFGLTSTEGNHGEDVKECYYYLDNTPTHSYMKYLYKYPQESFPYQQLREENRHRGTKDPEFELVDTRVFSENRYFDIFIEYAKASPEDLCIRIEAINRGTEEAPLHLLPQLWFRNQWSWGDQRLASPIISHGTHKGVLYLVADDQALASPSNLAFDYHLGKRYLYGPEGAELLFTENETHFPNLKGYFKDAIHRKVIQKENEAVNPEKRGTKACLHYSTKLPPGGSFVLRLRFSDKENKTPLEEVDAIIAERKKEADRFYETIHPPRASLEEKMIQRQAFAGMLWSKQVYLFDVNLWLKGDNTHYPPPNTRYHIRNIHWNHLNSMRVMSMPDKWEYPWFAAWDQAFHCLSFALIDLNFAKEQLWLLLFDQFQHPNGQVPAYEWEFSDLNPPVQAWAALRLFQLGKERHHFEDREFLEKCFHKLLINFAWWVNKVDSSGNNVFEGGFLGLDNITVLDRSQTLPGDVRLQQSDGTGWMAMFCLNLMRMALILAEKDPVYESLATKFFQHYVYIADAMKRRGNKNYEMWTEDDGFFYDVLTYPDGRFAKFRVKSLVGIIPLYAVDILDEDQLGRFHEFRKNFEWFMRNRKNIVEHCVIPIKKEGKQHYILALMDREKLIRVLKCVWDPQEFRSEFGLRSLSKYHEKHPFIFEGRSVGYEPAESLFKVKGGNSNWRGPIWIPTSFLLIDSLKKFSSVLQELKISAIGEEPISLKEMAESFQKRMINLFVKDANGKRPFNGEQFPFHEDPHWDHLLFYEYFNPETGKGLGASHQTGWSGLIANLIDELYRA